MLVAALIALAVTATVSCNDDAEWLSWKQRYNKVYETEVWEDFHRQIWQRNKAYVEEHNSKEDVTFKMELNQFADQESQRKPIHELHKVEDIQYTDTLHSYSNLRFAPSKWDWRDEGAVSPVKNQGTLADSEAIVAAECVESYHYIHSKVLPNLSSAEVHDCCTPTPVLYDGVFQCIHNIGGLCSATAYPQPKGKCMNDTCTAGAQIGGGQAVPSGQEDQLLTSVYKTPVLAAIDAGEVSFQLYTSGIYSDDNCSSTRLDHVVQIVGYGRMDGKDYWICKNSWGASWGMQGYILIARNKGNMCGIASKAMYPV